MMFSCLLWTLFGVIVAGPVQRATWSGGKQSFLIGHGGARLRPSFLNLPIFHHAPHPLVAPELFRPLSHKRPVPAGLTALLLPATRRPESVPDSRAGAVDVWCGVDQVSVRVDRFQLRTWTVPSLFRLGSCQPSKTSLRFLYFHYGLLECDGQAKVIGGQLVYTHSLTYTPPPQDYVLRAVPLNFPIHCQYNRFHYSYQVGFIPQLQHTTFMKNLKTKLSFSLTVCNAQWEPLPTGHGFFLGEQVYFVAQSRALLAGERLYVDACYATSSRDQHSTPRLEIISNLGCMTDSKREGSSSQFLSREASVVKFSVDAFLFKAISQTGSSEHYAECCESIYYKRYPKARSMHLQEKMLYLHCSMAIGLATSVNSKCCNYNKAAGRWEELEAQTSVCSCCDSVCTDTQHSMDHTVSSPGWFIGQKSEGKHSIENVSFQAEEARNWMNEKEKSEEELGENLKVPTSQTKTEVSHSERKDEVLSLSANKNKWKHSNAASWRGKKEELAEQHAHSPVEDLASDGNIMSDQSRVQENGENPDGEEVFRTNNDSVSSLSTNNSNSSSNPRNDSSGFDLHGLNENVSSAAIPTISPCTCVDKSCVTRGPIRPECDSKHVVHSPVNNDIAESVAAYSAGEQSVKEGQFDERLETLSPTRPDISYLPGFSHVRKLGKSRHESGKLNTQQLKPGHKLMNSKSGRISQQAGDSVSSNGRDEDLLLQITEFESEHSANPTGLGDSSCVDGLLCESDFESGIEGNKALHLSEFTGAAKMHRDTYNLSRTIPRKCSTCSGSASSEKMHQDSPSHSTGVAVSTQQGFTSHQTNDKEWVEAKPRWFVRKQPTESFDRWWRIYKHRLVYAGAQ